MGLRRIAALQAGRSRNCTGQQGAGAQRSGWWRPRHLATDLEPCSVYMSSKSQWDQIGMLSRECALISGACQTDEACTSRAVKRDVTVPPALGAESGTRR